MYFYGHSLGRGRDSAWICQLVHKETERDTATATARSLGNLEPAAAFDQACQQEGQPLEVAE